MSTSSVAVGAPLNAVQERCAAVLRSERASDELKATAKAMLAAGGMTSSQAKAAAQMTATASSRAKQAAAGWKCPQCTLSNPASAAVCSACGHVRRKAKAGGWECKECTLANPQSARHCKACGAPRADSAGTEKRPRGPEPPPGFSDDEDADAFR